METFLFVGVTKIVNNFSDIVFLNHMPGFLKLLLSRKLVCGHPEAINN